MTNHEIRDGGAAFDEDGSRLYPSSTYGFGYGLCSCGWMTPEQFEFGVERKRAFEDHLVESELDEIDDELDEISPDDLGLDLFGGPEEFPCPTETAHEAHDYDGVVRCPGVAAARTTIPDYRNPRSPQPGEISVEWPTGVPKIYWGALAKDGTEALAASEGLRRRSHEQRGELAIYVDSTSGEAEEAAAILAEELPEIFRRAYFDLWKWRKSEDYDGAGLPRKQSEDADRDFLTGFCYAFASVEFPADPPLGFFAGATAGVSFSEDLGDLL